MSIDEKEHSTVSSPINLDSVDTRSKKKESGDIGLKKTKAKTKKDRRS